MNLCTWRCGNALNLLSAVAGLCLKGVKSPKEEVTKKRSTCNAMRIDYPAEHDRLTAFSKSENAVIYEEILLANASRAAITCFDCCETRLIPDSTAGVLPA